MTESAEIEALYAQLLTSVQFAREALADGDVVPLDTLETKIAHLCQQVTELSPEEGRAWADRLQLLHDATGLLGQALTAERILVSQEIKGVSLHRKANAAYQSSLPPKIEGES